MRVLDRKTRFEVLIRRRNSCCRSSSSTPAEEPETERDRAELRTPAHLDVRIGLERLGDQLREVELLVERVSERRHAVQLEREPDAQAAPVARELGRVLAVVRQLAGRRQVLQVGRALVVRVPQRLSVADDQAARAVGQEQPLVRIERDGVAPLDPLEPALPAVGQTEEPTVGAVDVHPQGLPLRRCRRCRRAGRSHRCSSCRRSDPPGTAACPPRGPRARMPAGPRDPYAARRRSARCAGSASRSRRSSLPS